MPAGSAGTKRSAEPHPRTHLEHRDVAVAVDLGAGRVQQLDLAQVTQHLMALLEEGEVVLAEVELLCVWQCVVQVGSAGEGGTGEAGAGSQREPDQASRGRG